MVPATKVNKVGLFKMQTMRWLFLLCAKFDIKKKCL